MEGLCEIIETHPDLVALRQDRDALEARVIQTRERITREFLEYARGFSKKRPREEDTHALRGFLLRFQHEGVLESLKKGWGYQQFGHKLSSVIPLSNTFLRDCLTHGPGLGFARKRKESFDCSICGIRTGPKYRCRNKTGDIIGYLHVASCFSKLSTFTFFAFRIRTLIEKSQKEALDYKQEYEALLEWLDTRIKSL